MNKSEFTIDASKTFSTTGRGEQCNALLQAIHEAAYVNSPTLYKEYGASCAIYQFFDECPKTSLVVELVEELNVLGYEIVKKKELE